MTCITAVLGKGESISPFFMRNRLRGLKALSKATHLVEYGCSVSFFPLQVSSGHSSVTVAFLLLLALSVFS